MRGLCLTALLVVTACGGTEPPPASTAPSRAAQLDRRYDEFRAPGLDDRRFSPREYWQTVQRIVRRNDDLTLEQVGASVEGRPLRTIRYGTGETTVLLWSQMHGDESTASMSLADILTFLADRPNHPVAQLLAEELTIVFLPVLNPDGADRFQRRNVQGIDINRDARVLQTPEGQTLKRVRDALEPDFAFNLHDQGIRTRVGDSSRGAAIALLSPPQDASRAITPVRDRAIRVAAVIHEAIQSMVGGYVAKYDDTFNPRAFGDLMTQWGASTVLIESGGWADDPQKQYLRRVNFVGILAALEAIADGSWATADPDLYHSLPYNGRSIADLLLRGGTLAVEALEPLQADVLINYEQPLLETGGVIVDIGDMGNAEARDTIDVNGLYLVPLDEALDREGASVQIEPGAQAYFRVARRADGSGREWEFRGTPPSNRR